MKILHTADWHLGKYLGTYSRLEEQKAVLQEICEIAEKEEVDAVIVAGDLYDTYNPPIEATELLFKTFKRLSRDGKCAVIAIAGNHDSPDRIQAPEPLAKECGIIFLGYPYTHVSPFMLETGVGVIKSDKGFLELKLPKHETPLRLILTPYANESRLKTFLGIENKEAELRTVLKEKWQTLAEKYCDERGVNILAAHLFMIKRGEELPDENLEEEKSILYVGGSQAVFSEDIPPQMHYVALGHLHRHYPVDKVPCPIVYSSSPLAYSFAEANQKKYVVILEGEEGKPIKYKSVPLSQGKMLMRVRFEEVDEAVTWLEEHPDTLVEITFVSDSYISAKEKRKIYKAHKGIIAFIPEIKAIEAEKAYVKQIDLTKNMDELFVDFFKYKQTQTPNERLLGLFKEVLGEE